ncbi:MAG: preprotein translocase subunit SecB [Desulfobacterales bacterium SG8_35]|nr:MAG: preprotein translocase subunit SecB [Desulfobacterales bacterium SG8_35]
MTEQNATAAGPEAGAGATPVFRLEKLYLKDLSFESPNAPEAFFIQNPEHTVEMKLKLTNKKVDENHWEVCIEVSATIKDNKSDKVMFIIEIEHAGAFFLQNIPDEYLQQVLHVDCPTILFPYTRQIVSQASVEGGFMPFIMEPMNFAGMYQSKMQERKEQQTS